MIYNFIDFAVAYSRFKEEDDVTRLHQILKEDKGDIMRCMAMLVKYNDFNLKRLPDIDYEKIYKKVKDDFDSVTTKNPNRQNSYLEGVRKIIVSIPKKYKHKNSPDDIFNAFSDVHHSKAKSPPKPKPKSSPKAAPKAKSPPPIGPECIQTDHSKYLHSVIDKKVIRNDKLVLNMTKPGDNPRKKYIELSRIYHPDKSTDPHAKYLFGLIGDSYKRLK